MSLSSVVVKGLLAFVGCFLAVYVGEELLGGGALGWAAGGAILAVFTYPLFQMLIAWRQARQ